PEPKTPAQTASTVIRCARMPMQILGITRRDALQAGIAGTLATLLPQAADAAPPAPAPIGDDVGFLAFGATAESVLAAAYTQSLRPPGAWSKGENSLLPTPPPRHRDNPDRLNAALGPDDAVGLDDFAHAVRVGTRAGALKVTRDLEKLTTGVYL